MTSTTHSPGQLLHLSPPVAGPHAGSGGAGAMASGPCAAGRGEGGGKTVAGGSGGAESRPASGCLARLAASPWAQAALPSARRLPPPLPPDTDDLEVISGDAGRGGGARCAASAHKQCHGRLASLLPPPPSVYRLPAYHMLCLAATPHQPLPAAGPPQLCKIRCQPLQEWGSSREGLRARQSRTPAKQRTVA